jgi:hypothetical protein
LWKTAKCVIPMSSNSPLNAAERLLRDHALASRHFFSHLVPVS